MMFMGYAKKRHGELRGEASQMGLDQAVGNTMIGPDSWI